RGRSSSGVRSCIRDDRSREADHRKNGQRIAWSYRAFVQGVVEFEIGARDHFLEIVRLILAIEKADELRVMRRCDHERAFTTKRAQKCAARRHAIDGVRSAKELV